LSTINRANAAYAEEVARLTDALCEGSNDPLLREHAAVIAECDLVLRHVRAEQAAALERLQDATAAPLGKAGASLAPARALSAQMQLIVEEHSQYPGVLFPTGVDPDSFASRPPPPRLWRRPDPRPPSEAFQLALPELRKLERYARRAWSRKKKAVRAFLAAKTGAFYRLTASEPGARTT
jgi:hypothetical protein